MLAAYTKAINKLADSNNGVFVDLSHVASDDDLRKDPIHLNDAGYRETAIEIGKTLGFDDRWILNTHVEALRIRILKKMSEKCLFYALCIKLNRYLSR